MYRFVFLFILLPVVAFPQDQPTGLPDLRPLGVEFETYVPVPTSESGDLEDFMEPVGVLTLRDVLALALRRNPELAAFSWEVRVRDAERLQAGLLPNPQFQIEVEDFGGSAPFNGFDGSQTTIQLGQLIELGGKRDLRSQVASFERNLSGWDYERKRIDVFTEASQNFINVLSAQEQSNVADTLLTLAEQVASTISEKVKAGKVSPVEETRTQVAAATSRIEAERAKRALQANRVRLASSWGSNTVAFDRVSGNLDSIHAIPDFDQVVSRVVQNPDLARWADERNLRMAALQLEKAGRIPDPFVVAGIRRLTAFDSNAFVANIAIPLPLFNRNQGTIQAAQYRLEQADREKEAAEVRVRASLSDSYQFLSAAYAEATALKNEVLPGAQSAYDAVQEGYLQGKFGFLDVLDAQRTFFAAKQQYIQALTSYHKAVSEVERITGEPLSLAETSPAQNPKGVQE